MSLVSLYLFLSSPVLEGNWYFPNSDIFHGQSTFEVTMTCLVTMDEKTICKGHR